MAFEPSPPTAERLRHNMKLNDFEHITLVEAAVSDRPGTAVFSVQPVHRSAGSRLSALSRPPSARETSVETVSIDQLIQAGMPAPDVIKLDIEGAEIDASPDGVHVAPAWPHDPLRDARNRDKVIALLEAVRYQISFAEGEASSDWNRHVIAVPPDH